LARWLAGSAARACWRCLCSGSSPILAGVVWVALAPTSYRRWGGVHGALLGFFLYSVAVIVALWYRPGAMLRLNVWVLGADVVFALFLIHFTGGAESTFFLALLLIAGLQSYYYGMTRGVAVALASGRRLPRGWVADDRRGGVGQCRHPTRDARGHRHRRRGYSPRWKRPSASR
jgi:hypothetical protein